MKKIMFSIFASFGILIFFGGAVQASSVVAKNRITPEVKIEASANKNPEDKTATVDHLYHRAKMSFKIPSGAKDGDYFILETRGIPIRSLNNSVIRANNTEKTPVGEIHAVSESVDIRNAQLADDNEDFYLYKPEDSARAAVFNVVFNENVEKLSNVGFDIIVENQYQSFALANRDYSVKTFVKVNGELKFEETLSISKWPLYQHATNISTFGAEIVKKKNNYVDPNLVFVLQIKGNAVGKKIKISLSEDSKINFTKIGRYNIGDIFETNSNFTYTDKNIVNQYGLIKKGKSGALKVKIVNVEKREIVLEVLEQYDPEGANSGVSGINFEFDDAVSKNLSSEFDAGKITYTLLGAENPYSHTEKLNVKVKVEEFSSGAEVSKEESRGEKKNSGSGFESLVGIAIFVFVAGVIGAVVFILISSKKST